MIPAKKSADNAYRIHVLISKDEDGVFSAVANNLPGAGSCGDTEEEAIENLKEAVQGIIASYQDAGGLIPWREVTHDDLPLGAKQKWIIASR